MLHIGDVSRDVSTAAIGFPVEPGGVLLGQYAKLQEVTTEGIAKDTVRRQAERKCICGGITLTRQAGVHQVLAGQHQPPH